MFTHSYTATRSSRRCSSLFRLLLLLLWLFVSLFSNDNNNNNNDNAVIVFVIGAASAAVAAEVAAEVETVTESSSASASSLLNTNSDKNNNKNNHNHQKATKELIAWIESKEEGYYNPKQEERRRSRRSRRNNTSHSNNGNGIYATEVIEQDEIVLRIPCDTMLGYTTSSTDTDTDSNDRDRGAVMDSSSSENADNDEDDDEEERQSWRVTTEECRAVTALLREVQLGHSSVFAPHLQYLNLLDPLDLDLDNINNTNYDLDREEVHTDTDTTVTTTGMKTIPTVWSQEGKDLLEDMSRSGHLPPVATGSWDTDIQTLEQGLGQGRIGVIGMFSLLNHDMYGKCLIHHNHNSSNTTTTISGNPQNQNQNHQHEEYDITDPIVRQVIQIIISSSTSTSNRNDENQGSLIIPLMDNTYYNHGRIPNVKGQFQWDIKNCPTFELIATQQIQKGAQIVRSYTTNIPNTNNIRNNNKDVDDDEDEDDDDDDDDELNDYGTPELFRDYGIIEQDYPQIYHFEIPTHTNEYIDNDDTTPHSTRTELVSFEIDQIQRGAKSSSSRSTSIDDDNNDTDNDDDDYDDEQNDTDTATATDLVFVITPLVSEENEDEIFETMEWEQEMLPYFVQQLQYLRKIKRIAMTIATTATATLTAAASASTSNTLLSPLPKESTMTQYEWETAWDYHSGLTTVIEQIIQKYNTLYGGVAGVEAGGAVDDEDTSMCPGGHGYHNKNKNTEVGSCPLWDGGYAVLPTTKIPETLLELEFNENTPYGPTEEAYSSCNDEEHIDTNGKDRYVSVWSSDDTVDTSGNRNSRKGTTSSSSSIRSHYQEIFFYADPTTQDMCMKLDDTVQQCTSYRPHYHEFAVHFPARFLTEVNRVLFVGGGDSMVLHDVLKYPSLELVVGLELDQFVVRNSFRYFHSQPHFDDDRVEWWFGDGAKSLLMLPKSYFGSFDLVVVDLSETVMSFQVTDQLSIFQTLSLLLQPEGILLKNGEYYMQEMSQHFDYTLQYFEYDVPFICDQGMVIGSNQIDFFHRTMIDHGVDTLVYESQEEILTKHDNDPYYRFTEYRKNNAREQGHCSSSSSSSNESNNNNDNDNANERDVLAGEQQQQAGILLIVEAENLTRVTTIEEEALVDTLQKVGLTPLSTVSASTAAAAAASTPMTTTTTSEEEEKDTTSTMTTIVIVMEEGYITARIWPEKSYCALDIQLWGSFQLMEQTKHAVVELLGGSFTSSSSFRIVNGGMYGSSTMEKDRKIIGPRIVQSRHCDTNDDDDENKNENNNTLSTITNEGHDDDDTDDDTGTDTEAIILEESLILLDDDVVVAVICGVEGEACQSLDVLLRESSKGGGKIKKIIPVWTCHSLVDSSALFSQDIATKMTNCEVAISNTLSNESGHDKVSFLVVDTSAQHVLVKILLSIFSSVWNRKRIFSSHRFAILVPTTTPPTDDDDNNNNISIRAEWRRNFLILIREKITYRPMSLADLVIKKPNTGAGSIPAAAQTISVLSLNDSTFFFHLKEMISKFNKLTTTMDVMELQSIYDGLPAPQVGPFRPKVFKPDDYDLSAGKEQLAAQKSMGRQSLYQFEISLDREYNITQALKIAVEHTIVGMGWEPKKDVQQFVDGIGNGLVLVAIFLEGNVVIVWDGKSHIDVNLFSLDESENLRFKFSTVFSESLGIDNRRIKLALSDTHPRGTGRVVSFPVGN